MCGTRKRRIRWLNNWWSNDLSVLAVILILHAVLVLCFNPLDNLYLGVEKAT